MESTGTLPSMLCCVCGIVIQQNPSNMCVSCVRNTVDITEELSKKVTIHSCRTCGRFLAPPWQSMALESKELMTICLRKVSGLSKVKLIDAVWIWTEPHSMRLKIKLTIQKEVINGAVLQQAAIVEFIIRNQQCKNCEASFAAGAWHAIVQVRQRVNHKRTFFYLEQLILKHESHMECIKIDTFRDGMDFYFFGKNQALRFIEFLNGNVPTKVKYSRKLVSADHSANTANFKHNYLIEIAPICKDDLLILPKELARNLSNISRLVLTKRVGAGIHIIDPLTGERSEINTEKYWRFGFKAVMNSRQLIRYVVLSVEPVFTAVRPSAKAGKIRTGSRRTSGSNDDGEYSSSIAGGSVMGGGGSVLGSVVGDRKLRLAECVVARERDLGVNDTQFTCITHLGNVLHVGDAVLGYDFTCTNWNIHDDESDAVVDTKKIFPDLVLVRKCYDNKNERNWSLKQLDVDDGGAGMTEAEEEDYEHFMQQIEGDREMRSKLNIYKKAPKLSKIHEDSSAQKDMEDDSDDDQFNSDHIASKHGDDDEGIRLDELLEDMALEEENAKEEDIELCVETDAHSTFDASQFDPSEMKFI